MAEPREHRDVRDEILRDLRPVRPLRAPWLRVAMVFVPWLAVMLGTIAFAARLRPDVAQVGVFWSWGVSGVFIVSAFLLAACGVRESIPAAALPRVATWGFFWAVVCLQLAAAGGMHSLHPYAVAGGGEFRLFVVCSVSICAVAVTLSVLLVYVTSRGLPLRSGSMALLAGGASVIAAEALWRLHCPYTSPSHLVTTHFPPYVGIVSAGLLAGWVLRRRRARRPVR